MSQSDKISSTGGFPWKEILILLGVLITAYFGYLGIRSQIEIPIHATQTAEARLTTLSNLPSITPSATPSSQDLALTAIAIENQLTKEVGATATQQYLDVLQTVQANATATNLYQQVAAEQTQNVEATVQAIISTQQEATTIANNKKIEQLQNFVNQVPTLSATYLATFDESQDGWRLKKNKKDTVSIGDGILKVNLSTDTDSPLVLLCDSCGQFNKFAYQIDIKTPQDIPRIVSGVVFGSNDSNPRESEYYALSIYSSGDVILERFSPFGRDIVKVWEHRKDLLTADGNFHTLQIVGFDKYAAVYIDSKPIGEIFSLNYSAQGYIGLIVQSKDVDILYDNLKVVLSP